MQFLSPLINLQARLRQITPLLFYIALAFCFAPASAQVKRAAGDRDFAKELADAGLSFTLPAGFKEIKAPATEDSDFDYAITLPDADFEIWFEIKSLKTKPEKVTNLDSAYVELGRLQADAFMGDKHYLTRTIPQYALERYNANAGKTYVLNLPDSPTTRHYKYAMVVALQKNHEGTLLAVCLSNELGPGFFKNVNMANGCIKFNP